jgi:hypothetical protein
LSLLKYYFISFIFISSSLAAQWATVTAQKAIIYSDLEMKSPIGFFIKDKKIRIADKTRSGGRLFPTVIRKRIVYIKVDDIVIGEKLQLLESASKRIKDVQTKENEKRVSLFYNGYASFMSLDKENPFSKESSEGTLFYYNGFGVKGYLSNYGSKKTWRVSVESSSTATELNEFSVISLIPEISYDILKFDNYAFRIFAGVILSPFVQYSYDDLFTVNGYGAGISTGAEMEFKFKKSFGFHVDAGYRVQKYFLELPQGPSSDEDKFNPLFNGVSFSASISYGY